MLVNSQELDAIARHLTIERILPFGQISMLTFVPEFGTNPFLTLSLDPQGTSPLRILNDPPSETNVPIAAAVTAYSRMIINQYKLDALELGLELYYSDTDLLVVNGPLPDNFLMLPNSAS